MKKLFTVLFLIGGLSFGQVSIAVGVPPSDITFSSFTGAGFSSSPSVGQLNSNEWKITGLSDGTMNFGDTKTSGDFARGASPGGITTGGVYSFDVGSSNNTLGIQPGGDDMTPGKITLRLVNVGSENITKFSLSYKIYYRNDQGRSNSFNFAYSLDDVNYTSVPSADFSSPEVADGSPSWQFVSRTINITGINVAQNSFIYIQWISDDISGSGSRDEFGLDEISFFDVFPVELTTFTASALGNYVKLDWETATEVNNYGFEIQRKSSLENYKVIDFVQGNGNSNSPKLYSYEDKSANNSGKYIYRLKQIDIDGTYEYSDEVEVILGSPEKIELGQNYPNPFNPVTSIQFNLPNESQVRLSVFNILGEEIALLLNEKISAGYHTVNFNGSNLNSGIYFYQIQTDNFTQIRKMILVK